MNFYYRTTFFFLLLIPGSYYGQDLEKYTYSHPQMGTEFRIILYAENKENADLFAQKAMDKIDKLNAIFSDYLPESELSRLSRTAGKNQKVRVSEDLWRVMKESKRFSRKSKGAFDITIGPLSKLWRSMFRQGRLFEKEKISAAKTKVNYRNIKHFPLSKTIELTQAMMRLDLGGIAKGYTVDQVVQLLNQAGYKQILVDGGGDIYAGDPPPNKKGWHIKIKKQTGSDHLLLKNKAIAVSGDTYRFLEWQDHRYSHIIDPRTGYGVTHKKIIHVLANDCTSADALASTLSVLNETESKRFLKKWKKVEVLQDVGN